MFNSLYPSCPTSSAICWVFRCLLSPRWLYGWSTQCTTPITVMAKSCCQGQGPLAMLPHPGRRVCRASSLSAGYAVLYPSAAPGEGRLDPARGSWAVFMQMAAERALIPWSQPSFIPRDTRALTVKPHLLFLPGSYPIHLIYIIYILRSFDGPNILPFIKNAKSPLGLISSGRSNTGKMNVKGRDPWDQKTSRGS